LMNATGVPIALHAQKTLEHFGPSYKVSSLLEKQVAAKQNWDLTGTDTVVCSPEKEKAINERILGSTFFVCSQILEENVCSAVDLNRGAKIGLRWRFGPVDLMNKYNDSEVTRLINAYTKLYNEKVPSGISKASWKMDYVTLEINNAIATITMSRPEDMNALNEEVMEQLDKLFTKAEASPNVKTIILTGSGKAFVAGADIKFFVKNIKSNTLNNIVSFTGYGQEVLNKIDKSPKKVVCILNGMALGGGMELALCCDVLLAVPKTKIAFPETGIGIYPGLGGTQRTRERLGKGLAKFLVLTGQMLDANTALEIGLIDAVIQPAEIFDYTSGKKTTPDKNKAELNNHWKVIASLYENNSYQSILTGNYNHSEIAKETVDKLAKTMKQKAPIAMSFAETLIEEAKGPASELDKLVAIFSTKDALLGLTSIGKKVEYKGE
ncbi:MAG: enoyl-CoA hydratase/isomerase family protein, partial [Bacteroidia bacterium]|nr:enoyl-CoA hydratase/isomerase family protein [Bacteroidia bacterium]